MTEFEKRVDVEPAFEKLAEGYGIGACRIRFVLKGPLGAVQFLIGTNWYVPTAREHLKQFPPSRRNLRQLPDGWDVGYHSPKPMYEDQSPPIPDVRRAGRAVLLRWVRTAGRRVGRGLRGGRDGVALAEAGGVLPRDFRGRLSRGHPAPKSGRTSVQSETPATNPKANSLLLTGPSFCPHSALSLGAFHPPPPVAPAGATRRGHL